MLKFLKHFNPPLQQSPLKNMYNSRDSLKHESTAEDRSTDVIGITFDNNQVVLHNCVCNYIDSLIVGELVQLILTVS